MGELMKERFAAIFIGSVMVLSVAGWALMQIAPQDTGPEFSVPTIVTRELSSDEIVYVLQTGRVLIENFYTTNCTQCLEDMGVLESFAGQYDGFVVLEEVEANYTKLEMIGMGGQIVELEHGNITFNGLLDIFCKIAIAQPPECLL